MKKLWTMYNATANAKDTSQVEVNANGFKAGTTLSGLRVLSCVRKGSNNARYRLDAKGKEAFAVVPNDWFQAQQAYVFDKPVEFEALPGSDLTTLASLDQFYFWYTAVMTASPASSEKVDAVFGKVLEAVGMTPAQFMEYRCALEDFLMAVKVVGGTPADIVQSHVQAPVEEAPAVETSVQAEEVPDFPPDENEDVYWSNRFAEQERRQEELAYRNEMEYEIANGL